MTTPTTPAPRALAWSAFHCGALVSVLIRPSSHAPGGWAFVARFSRPDAAAAFARKQAARIGRAVAVREHGLAVSVPVFLASSRVPRGVCFPVPAAGGVRMFARCLSAAGFLRPMVSRV
jgi:hypothetical protein